MMFLKHSTFLLHKCAMFQALWHWNWRNIVGAMADPSKAPYAWHLCLGAGDRKKIPNTCYGRSCHRQNVKLRTFTYALCEGGLWTGTPGTDWLCSLKRDVRMTEWHKILAEQIEVGEKVGVLETKSTEFLHIRDSRMKRNFSTRLWKAEFIW